MNLPQNIEQMYQLIQQKKSNKQHQNYRFNNLLKYFDIFIPPSQVIKIAGTNGKGSVSAMLEAMIIADDKKVVLFTSPHLCRITERFRINGQEIEAKVLDKLAQKMAAKLLNIFKEEGDYMVPSFFEVLTIIALQVFELYQANFIILEAGIGGYNDVIHLINGQISSITSVGLDHRDKLGSTLSEIAADKVGIASNNSILVLASDIPDPAKNSIIKDADRRFIKLIEADSSNFKVKALGLQGYQISLNQESENLSFILPLIGSFQIDNFATAKTIFEQLIINQAISQINSLKGVSNVYWPGRMEVIKGSPTWLLDVAHNSHAIEKITQQLPDLIKTKKLSILLGLSDHHNSDEIVSYLDQLIEIIGGYIYLTSGFYRAIEPEKYLNFFEKNRSNLKILGSYKTAIDQILNIYQGQDNHLVFITGSLFLVGGCREYLLTVKS